MSSVVLRPVSTATPDHTTIATMSSAYSSISPSTAAYSPHYQQQQAQPLPAREQQQHHHHHTNDLHRQKQSHRPLSHLQNLRYQQQQHPDDENDVPELQVRILLNSDNNVNNTAAADVAANATSASLSSSTSPSYQTLEVRWVDLHRREEEMLRVARAFAVPLTRWNGSRLYKFYREQNDLQQQQQQDNNFSGAGASLPSQNKQEPHQQELPLVLTLDPTKFCRDQRLSQVFVWKPWLGHMMQSYFHTGVLTVRHDATGDDWLICCEYFGILYQPSQVVFETLKAYQNVSAWSEYLSKRCDIAEWVADAVMRKHQTVFVVSQEDEGWSVEVDQHPSPAALLLVENNHGNANKNRKNGVSSPTPSAGQVSPSSLADFFYDEDHPVSSLTRQARMREDFAGYLDHVLSHVQCRFDMELVTLTLLSADRSSVAVHLNVSQQRFASRAVLRIRLLLHPPPPPNLKKNVKELPFPVDELVEEDLQRGTLEKLVQQVDARIAAAAAATAQPNYNNSNKPTTASISSNRLPSTSDNAGNSTTAPIKQHDEQTIKPTSSSPGSPTPPYNHMALAQPPLQQINEGTTYEPEAIINLADLQNQQHRQQIDGLPFNIIRTHSTGEENQSVTSALTGPFFLDEEGSISHVPGHGPAEDDEGAGRGTSHHWWKHQDRGIAAATTTTTNTTKSTEITSSNITHSPTNTKDRVKALLDDATTTADVDATSGAGVRVASVCDLNSPEDNIKKTNEHNASCGPATESSASDDSEDPSFNKYHYHVGEDEEVDQWDWLTSICHYSAALLSLSPSHQDQQQPSSCKENQRNVMTQCMSYNIVEDTKRKATLIALQKKAALVRSQVRRQKNPTARNTLTAMRQDDLQEQLHALTNHSGDVDLPNNTTTTSRHPIPITTQSDEKFHSSVDPPPPTMMKRTPPPLAPHCPTQSTDSSEGLVERPEPPPPKSQGHDYMATNRKRPGLKGLFRRRKLNADV